MKFKNVGTRKKLSNFIKKESQRPRTISGNKSRR